MLSSVLNSIKKHFTRRNLLFIAIICTALFVLSDTSFAADPTPQPAGGNPIPTGLDQGIKGVSTVLSVLTSLVTLFLHPGWYNGDIFDINVYLKQIWILVSNIVYFIFAILLVWIALMNIIGKGGDYELKKQLPKFIVGILIVPFSWFIVQFMLSLSSVLTVAVLTLPYDSFKNFEGQKNFMQNIKVPKKCTISIGGNTSSSNNSGKSSKGGIDCGEDSDTQTAYEMFSGGDSGKGPQQSVFGIMTVYTYGILDMGEASKITMKQVSSPDGIKSILNLGLKMAFSVFFIIVYLILLFALFLALFVRGVQLWIYMMISPLFGLFYYFGGGSIGKLGKLSNFNLSNFIGLAMMPVYVSAALSFGLLFIGVVDYGMQKSGNGNTEMVKCNGNGANQECSLKLGGFELVIKGALGKDGTNGTPGLGGSPIGYLIMQMFAIVVLWTSVMAALKTSKLTESVIQPFEHFGSEVGSVIQKIPQYAPIPGTGGFSASTLGTLGSDLSSKISTEMGKSERSWIKKNAPFASIEHGQTTSELEGLKSKATAGEISAIRSGIDKLGEFGDVQGIMHSPAAMDHIKASIKGLKLPDTTPLGTDKEVVNALRDIEKALGGKGNDEVKKLGVGDVEGFNKILKSGTSATENKNQSTNLINNVSFSFNGITKDNAGKITDKEIDRLGGVVVANLGGVGIDQANKIKSADLKRVIIAKGAVSEADADTIIAGIKNNSERKKIISD